MNQQCHAPSEIVFLFLSHSFFFFIMMNAYSDTGIRRCTCQGQMTSFRILEMAFVVIYDFIDRAQSC